MIDGVKDGITLEKGVILSEERIMKNKAIYEYFINIFTAYPDIFLDLIAPAESNVELYFYQRIFLRACMRYRYHYCVAPRAFSKSFLSIMAEYLKCIFQPGSKVFICAPKKEQSAKIAIEKITEIWDLFPLLKKEILSKNFGTDYVKLTFRNGSVFDVVYAGDSQRGGRRHSGIIDEVRDHDADLLNDVVLPLMNVNRRTKARIVNPYEPQQQQIYITSAGQKSTFAYEKLIEILIMSAIKPDMAFCWGCDYRVPMICGLLDKQYVDEMRMSATYKDSSFAKEYLSLWVGGSEESWFDYERLTKHRTIMNPERKAKFSAQSKDAYYEMAIDVARLDAQTVITIIKVLPREEFFLKKIVNIKVLQNMHFAEQALEIKKMKEAFKPKEIVIDGNGLTTSPLSM